MAALTNPGPDPVAPAAPEGLKQLGPHFRGNAVTVIPHQNRGWIGLHGHHHIRPFDSTPQGVVHQIADDTGNEKPATPRGDGFFESET